MRRNVSPKFIECQATQALRSPRVHGDCTLAHSW